MHTFLTECVMKYAQVKNIPLEQACPLRCHKSAMTIASAVDEAEGAANSIM